MQSPDLEPRVGTVFLLLCACASKETPTSAGFTADVHYTLDLDGVSLCDIDLSWAGKGTAEACPGCDFIFDVTTVTASDPDDADCLDDGPATLWAENGGYGYGDGGPGGWVGFWQSYPSSTVTAGDTYAYSWGAYTDLFATGNLGYRVGGSEAIAWESCGEGCTHEPPGTLTRKDSAITWTWRRVEASPVDLPPHATDCLPETIPTLGHPGTASVVTTGTLIPPLADTWRLSGADGVTTVWVDVAVGTVRLDLVDPAGCFARTTTKDGGADPRSWSNDGASWLIVVTGQGDAAIDYQVSVTAEGSPRLDPVGAGEPWTHIEHARTASVEGTGSFTVLLTSDM